MNTASMTARGKPGFALGGLTLCVLSGTTFGAGSQPAFVQDGKAGFVVTEIQYALGLDAEQAGACPDGMTEGMRRDGPGGYGSGAPGCRATPGGYTTL